MTSEPVNRFAILGFPKCGTTGLARHLANEPALNVLRSNGTFEVDLTKGPSEGLQSGAINGHKLATYVYDDQAIKNLLAMRPDCLFILCFRHPRCALHSWHAMHHRVACGEPSDHPAWRDRQFYGACSVTEYFQRHAWPLHYDIHLARLLDLIPKESLRVYSRLQLADKPDAIVADILSHFGEVPKACHKPYGRKAFGDQQSIHAVTLSIRVQLDQVFERFTGLLAKSGVRHIV